jgi:hypothetical protein
VGGVEAAVRARETAICVRLRGQNVVVRGRDVVERRMNEE